MENTNFTQSIKKQGNLNPMYGKRHTEITKQKISDSQKERYEKIRKELQSEDTRPPIGRTDKVARMELLNQCLNKDTIGFDTVEQAHNFVAIMMQDEEKNYIQRVIKEEIENVLRDKNRHSRRMGI